MSDPTALQDAAVSAAAGVRAGSASAEPHYRIDKFIVPAAARDEFVARVFDTHAALRREAGFLQDMVLEQQSGPGTFNIVTLVEWANADVLRRVSEAVERRYAEIGFDRQEVMTRLGITADIANYARVTDA
jgi:hypothetical protein